MEDAKRIITRAVYGHKIQTFRNIVRIAVGEGERLTDILGCTVTGAMITGSSIEEDDGNGKKVKVSLKLDIHAWYRSENDTKVSKTSAEFTNVIVIAKQGPENYKNEEVKVLTRRMPKCVEKAVVQKEANLVEVQIESELEAEIIGETVLNIKVF